MMLTLNMFGFTFYASLLRPEPGEEEEEADDMATVSDLEGQVEHATDNAEQGYVGFHRMH